MKREPGFYWVKTVNGWEIAKWVGEKYQWRIDGIFRKEISLFAIHETRLMPPD